MVYRNKNSKAMMWTLGTWIITSKLVKTMPHFLRYPRDLVYFPGYVLFGYFHSLIQLYALFTFWEMTWGSRKNAGVA